MVLKRQTERERVRVSLSSQVRVYHHGPVQSMQYITNFAEDIKGLNNTCAGCYLVGYLVIALIN